MAEDLHDGEFWLPSCFLTDDDIVLDCDVSNTTHGGSLSSFPDSPFEFESDEEFSIAHLHSSCPVHSKVNEVLSSSPQSTLFGCVCNQSSSRESVSPPQPQPQGEATATATSTATFDLLNKAAGEVARLKIRIENEKNNHNNNNKKVVGTGFFDCTQKGVYPPPLLFPPQFLHFPHPMVWPPTNTAQQPPPQPPSQNRATNSENKSNKTNNKNNRPLGLPQSAWPPLQAQPQAKSKAQTKPMQTIPVGPPKGTGVFLPRCVPTTPVNQPRKKDGNATKSKTGKGSQSQSNHRRNSGKTSTMTTTKTTTANLNDIQLPQEWIY